ncbi:MAG: hypothetical protein HYX63_16585 [Gammaproteobacteria bacterium]|nr:hypothetical protein [Gammaproteobacteria bacterium]
MQHPTIHADIVETWQRLGENRPTLAFACDIAHAKHIAASFNDAGISASSVDAYQNTDERRDTIKRFKAGEIRVLVSVACLSVGFDAPIAACALLARPTKPLTVHLQQIGRVLRPYSDKADAIVLDHSGNIERHGLPDDIAIGALNTHTKTWSVKAGREPTPKPCQKCAFLKPPSTHKCLQCGFALERQSTVQRSDGELIALTTVAALQSNRRLYQEYLGCAEHFDKSRGWAYYLCLAKTGEKPAWSWNSLTAIEPSDETLRYAKSQLIRFAKRRAA